MLQDQGFVVATQFETWEDAGHSIPVGRYEDVVTAFRR